MNAKRFHKVKHPSGGEGHNRDRPLRATRRSAMPAAKSTSARSRTGGRSARVVRDVLAAALTTFAENGYAGLSIEAVALRAGVNKTTIYRRWPSKAELLEAALFSLRDNDPPAPDTGSLREDLLLILSHLASKLATPARRAIMTALLLNSADPELAALIQRLRRERPAIPLSVLGRAIARGALPRGTDARLVGETLMGAVQARAFWKRETLDQASLRALIELVVAGAEAGGACHGVDSE